MEIISVILSIPRFIRELGDLPSAWRYKADPGDIEVLKKLWRYINSENVTELLEGVLNDSLDFDLVGVIGDDYLSRRRHPEYQLYDRKLEQKLEQFDASLAELFSYTSVLFAQSSTASKLRISYRQLAKRYPLGIETPEFSLERREHQKMNTAAKQVHDNYQDVILYLRRRRLLHVIAWSTNEKSMD